MSSSRKKKRMTLGEISLLMSSEKCSVYVIYIGVHSRTLSGYIIFNYLTTSEKTKLTNKTNHV